VFNLFKRNGNGNGSDSSNGHSRPANAVIDLRGVIKSYATPAGEFQALKGIDLQVAPGEFVAVIGKSGSGKSTLTNMITGIDRPTQGEVIIAGTAVHKLNEGQTASWRGRNVGVVFQFFQLLPSLTVMENVLLPMDFCNMYSERERRERALHLLDQVEMVDQAHKLPTALSGGQQQRVAIARSMANDPALIVADEPTGNLDSRTADAVFHLFETLVSEGKTIVMVTHDDDMARRVTRAVTIADGRIESDTQIVPAAPALVIPEGVGVLHAHEHGHPVPVPYGNGTNGHAANGNGHNGNGHNGNGHNGNGHNGAGKHVVAPVPNLRNQELNYA
jgi:putative ABC transport system ATP-binding protein